MRYRLRCAGAGAARGLFLPHHGRGSMAGSARTQGWPLGDSPFRYSEVHGKRQAASEAAGREIMPALSGRADLMLRPHVDASLERGTSGPTPHLGTVHGPNHHWRLGH